MDLRVVASVCILLRLAELGGQSVGATQLRLQVRDTSKVGTVLQLEKFTTNHFFFWPNINMALYACFENL